MRELAETASTMSPGTLAPKAVATWTDAGRPLQVTPGELVALVQRGEVTVIDVRGGSEWPAEHIPHCSNIPLAYLCERTGELPHDRQLILHCQTSACVTDARSAIGVGLLQARGFANVSSLQGGFTGWRAAGHPIVAAKAVLSVNAAPPPTSAST